MELEIKCRHEAKDTAPDERVPDYHPLTKHELWALLNLASVASSRLVTTIQIRLEQAVRGMTCPRPYEDETAERLNGLDRLYVTTYQQDPRRLPDMVEEFYKLLEP